MTIIEAIKSGKRFRRYGAAWYSRYQYGYLYQTSEDHRDYQQRFAVSQEDLVADDWEVEKPRVDLSREQVIQALRNVNFNSNRHETPITWDMMQDIVEELGL